MKSAFFFAEGEPRRIRERTPVVDRSREARDRAISISPVIGRVSRARAVDERAVWVAWWRKVLFSKAELDVRPPPTRRDHLAGDQCSGADKSHERARLGPSAGRSSKGPHDEGGAFPSEAFLLSCLPFVSFTCPRRSRPQEPAVRAETPEPTGPSCFASK